MRASDRDLAGNFDTPPPAMVLVSAHDQDAPPISGEPVSVPGRSDSPSDAVGE